MDKQQDRLFNAQLSLFDDLVLRVQDSPAPAVKFGWPGKLAFDSGHQCRGALLRGSVDGEIGGFLFEQFLGQLSDVVIFEHQLPDLPPDPIRCTTVLALDIDETGEIDRPVEVNHVGAGTAQLLHQGIGANVNGRAVVGIQRQQRVRIVQGIAVRSVTGARRRCQLLGFQHPHIT